MKKLAWVFTGILVILIGITHPIWAQLPPGAELNVASAFSVDQLSRTITLLLQLGIISFIPFLLVSTTSFVRFVIVMSLLRQAIGTQSAPPNMVIVSLALFLTIFVMTPTFNAINQEALTPFREGRMSQFQAMEVGSARLKEFMLNVTREKDLALFIEFSKIQRPDTIENTPLFVVIPAFLISELRAAFQIAFVIFIPFVVVDLVISNILLSLGMFMLSPAMISLPFKILLFVLTDGWNLIIRGLLLSYK